MTSPRQLWRRAAGAVKDKRSLYLTRMVGWRHHHHHLHHPGGPGKDVEAAIILATSHDERSIDHKNSGRVLAWARAAPSMFLDQLMWSLARRVARTRSWVVALKSLLLAHGILLCSDDAPPATRLGRLPFDLSDFSDRNSSSMAGFSAFVRAYFRFLDHRFLFDAQRRRLKGLTLPHSPALAETAMPAPEVSESDDSEPDADLERLERLQILLDLLMQIRPYANGMEISLVLEAMDCTVIEIFEVYSSICTGIAHFLVGIQGSSSAAIANSSKPNNNNWRRNDEEGVENLEARRRRGAVGMRILRQAALQNSQLSAYFDLCRTLGVLNATEFPPVERIPEEDINDLERLMLSGITENEGKWAAPPPLEDKKKTTSSSEGRSGTLITKDWVVFDDEGHSENHILFSPEELWTAPSPLPVTSRASWALMVNSGIRGAPLRNRNLIELI